MKDYCKKRSGQFVIISAVIIASLTLSLVLSIHQISINSQQLSYQPVEELLLGLTSDLDRCLTYGLSLASHEFNSSGSELNAKVVGTDFIRKWGSSIVGAYSNIGLRIDLKESMQKGAKNGVVWTFSWGNMSGLSQCYTEFSMDIDAYGFKGWTATSTKFVTININSIASDFQSKSTTLVFTLEEGKDNENRKPVQNLTPDLIRLTLNKSGQIYYPNIISLVYLGQGTYRLTFGEYFLWDNILTIRVTTPDDRIVVGAFASSSIPEEWNRLFLSQYGQGNPVLVPTRITGKDQKIQSNFTQSGHETMEARSPPTPFPITLARNINITLYLEVSQNQSPIKINVTFAFEYNGTVYKIGSNTTYYLGSGPYNFQLDATKGTYPTYPRLVPPNSTFILYVEAIFERQPYGRLFLNYGPGTPSNVDIF